MTAGRRQALGAVVPGQHQARLAQKVCGVVDLWLPADGEAEAELREPAGMSQLAVVDDIPDPYAGLRRREDPRRSG